MTYPDSFLPNLDVQLPQFSGHCEQPMPVLRRLYQQAMLEVFAQPKNEDCLHHLQQALHNVLLANPQQPALWWVSCAYVDCMLYDGLDVAEYQPVLKALDALMRDLISHHVHQPAQTLLYQMLYRIARSSVQSELVERVKHVYELVQYLPDEIQAELLPIFLEEADELLPQIQQDISSWQAQPQDAQISARLWRQLHTLKGSARMTGAMKIGLLLHKMEHEVEQNCFDYIAVLCQQVAEQVAFLRPAKQPEPASIGHLHRPKVKQHLLSTRLVMFNTLQKRLQLVVQSAAKELGKRVQLEIQGGHVLFERDMLKRITAPLEHMLRNSVVHGIESPDERARLNKPSIGCITLNLQRTPQAMMLALKDDGAGLNLQALREKAIAQGHLAADEVVSEQELARLVFIARLSTAKHLTQLAGRGVGMDVAYNEINALGGSVEVETVTGQGARFILRLPVV